MLAAVTAEGPGRANALLRAAVLSKGAARFAADFASGFALSFSRLISRFTKTGSNMARGCSSRQGAKKL
jgi:hypothetical protein